MGEWPDDWFRDGRDADGDGTAQGGAPKGAGTPKGAGASSDKTVSIPAPSRQPGGAPSPTASRGPAGAPPPGAWPSQPPMSSARGELCLRIRRRLWCPRLGRRVRLWGRAC